MRLYQWNSKLIIFILSHWKTWLSFFLYTLITATALSWPRFAASDLTSVENTSKFFLRNLAQYEIPWILSKKSEKFIEHFSSNEQITINRKNVTNTHTHSHTLTHTHTHTHTHSHTHTHTHTHTTHTPIGRKNFFFFLKIQDFWSTTRWYFVSV